MIMHYILFSGPGEFIFFGDEHDVEKIEGLHHTSAQFGFLPYSDIP